MREPMITEAILDVPNAWSDSDIGVLEQCHCCVFGRRIRVELAGDMPGKDLAPKHILQECH